MPQTVSKPVCRGRGRHEYMKPNGVANNYTPATTLLNGACVNRAFPAVVNPPVGLVNGAKPCGMANGAWPAMHIGVTTPSTAGVVNGRTVPDDCLAKCTITPGTIGLPNGSGLAAPEKNGCEASVQMKNRKQGKRPSWKKKCARNKAFVFTPPPPREEEDWEAETVEVPPVKWGQISHGTKPYGVTTPSTAGVVNGRSVPDDSLAKGTIAPGTNDYPRSCDLAEPEKNGCEASVQMKNRKQGKKSFWKKRKEAFVFTPPPPREEEDWDAEIVEVPPVKWGQISYGTKPYGPEDKLGFVPQGLLQCHMAIPILPQMGDYSPARYHPRPIKWSCYRLPTEPDQFADTDE